MPVMHPPQMTFYDFIWGVVFIGGIITPIVRWCITKLWHIIFLRTEKELLIWEHYIIKRFKKRHGLRDFDD